MQGGLPGLPRSFAASRVFEVLLVMAGLALLREGRSPHQWPWIWGGLLGVGVLSASLSTHPGLGRKEALLEALGLAFPDLIFPGLGPTSMDPDSLSVQGFVRPRFWGDGL